MPAENVKMEWCRTGMLRSDFTAQERNELLKQAEEKIKHLFKSFGFKEVIVGR